MTIFTYRAAMEQADQLTERVRDLAVLTQRLALLAGHESTARQLGELIQDLDPDPGYAETPFG